MNYFEQIFSVKQEILNCVQISDDEVLNEETGEIIDVKALEELKMDLNDKVYNIGMWLKNKRVEADALKVEKLKLAKRQNAAENDIEMLTSVLEKLLNGEKFNDPSRPLLNISYRQSKKVVIDDINALPEEYIKRADPEAKKADISKAIKSGMTVAGAHLEETTNIQIK